MNNPSKFTPIVITILYAALSLIWILFSDKFMMSHTHGTVAIAHFSTIKGLLFIGITSLFLYVFIRRVVQKQIVIEQKLRETATLYQAMFETGPDAFFLVNEKSGEILDANRVASALYGYSKDEFLRLNLDDISEDLEMQKRQRETPFSHLPIRYHIRKDGTVFVASFTSKAILVDGKPVSMATVRNVTKQVEAEKILLTQRNLNTLLSRSHDINTVFHHVINSLLHFDGIDIVDIALIEEKSNSISIFVNEGNAICEVMNSILDSTGYLQKPSVSPLYIGKEDIPTTIQATFLSEDIKSCAFLPIKDNDKTVAVLFVASLSAEEVSETFKRALEAVVNELCVAISRINIFDALNEERKNLQTFFDAIDDLIMIKNLDGSILHVNPATEEILGYSSEELQGMNSFQLYPAEKQEEAHKIIEAIIAGDRNSCPLPFLTKKGKLIPVDTRSCVRKWSDMNVIFSISRDMTTHIAMDEKMRHANRLYAFLSHINQAIVRTHDSDQLMREVVSIAVEQGGFLFTWIGMAGIPGEVYPIAHNSMDGTCNPGDPEIMALDSSLHVINTGMHHINNEIILDPRYMSWFSVISKCNIKSSGSFPIKKLGKTVGTLNLYSGESNFFSPSEVGLLEKVAESISYALEYIEHEEQRKLAEDRLRASEITYRTIFESVNDVIFVHDKSTGALLDINRHVLDMFGYTRDEMLENNGLDWFDKINVGVEPYTKESALVHILAAAQGKPQIFDWLARRKDESTFNQEVSLKVASVGGREVVLAVVRDVTVRVRAKEALQKAIVKVSEEKSKTEAIIAAISDGISVQDSDFRIIYQNQLMKNMFGDYVGMYCYEAYEKRLEPCNDCHHIKTFRDGKIHRRTRTNLINGKPRYYEITTSPILDVEKNVTACLEIVRDTTAHRLAEEKITESERKFKTLFNHAADAIFIHDLDGRFVDVNLASVERLGYSFDEYRKMNVKAIDSPKFAVKAKERIAEVCQKENLVFETEHISKEGTRIPVEISARVINYGGDTFILSIGRDITERKKAMASLRESEEKFRSIFEDSKDMIFICSPNGEIEDINPSGVELLGYSTREEVLRKGMLNDNIFAYSGDWSKMLHAIKENGFVKDFETFIANRDTALLTVKLTATALYNDADELVSLRGIIRDVTQETIIERQLQQSQKMEAVGQFAGGVAHDFNNVLTAILGYGALVRDKLKSPETKPLQTYMTQIIKSAERAASLTNSLLSFSRRQTVKPEIINLNDIIDKTVKIFKRIVREDIDVQVLLSDEFDKIVADVGQIEQVIMNLINNANDAMPKGGILKIQTQLVNLDDHFVNAKGYGNPGKYVMIKVSDTGHGMSADILERVFEPFFTTKAVGKGTGLGMSIVYGIIKQHEGYIDVFSEQGQGTEFKIYLPMISGIGEVIVEDDQQVLIGGGETILVVEDDPTARLVACSALREYGYNVIEAVDGSEAIQKYYDNQDDIDMLLLDVVMPKKNGKEVYDQIIKKRPWMKHLFVSGYTGDILNERGILEEGLNFIAKPYSTKVLIQKIRTILDH